MKKLMIASPCHHGKCDVKFTLSLIQSLYLLDHSNIQTQILLPSTGSILSKERNDIIEAFWKSDCSHLLCVDSDVSWEPDAPLKFLQYDTDIIGGVYPARRNNDTLPKFMFLPETDYSGRLTQKPNSTLLKMIGIPAGFMMISRDCVKKMRDFYPEKKYKGSNNFEDAFAFFNTEIRDGMMWGEDYIFCKNAIDAGIDIWCDPNIMFEHAGTVGKLSEILTNQIPKSDIYSYKPQ